MFITVKITFDKRVSPPGFYGHLERLPKRKRADFVRRTAWSGFAGEQDNGQRSSDGQSPPDKLPSVRPQIDPALEDEIRDICLSEDD